MAFTATVAALALAAVVALLRLERRRPASDGSESDRESGSAPRRR
ncbi:hypothetical protein [Actinomadura fibrosa]|nr:hypothetical protein [Actinomadura fibrosa]